MSLQLKILNLISGITDPKIRIDVASTINFLYNVYVDGRAGEEEVLSDLHNICRDVLTYTYPLLGVDEIEAKSREMAEDFLREFKVEGLRQKIIRRLSSRLR